MKDLTAVITIIIFCFSVLRATDQSENGVPTSPLKIYSCGFGTGALMSLNEELRDVSRQFFRISVVNTFSVRDHLSLFLDADWLAPKGNVGADLGVDAIFLRQDFRPFVGVGLGVHYIDRDEPFGDSFGPSFTAHAGFSLDLSDNVAVRMRLPYHFIFTKQRDQAIGVDFGFIFSSRFKKVRKLNHN